MLTSLFCQTPGLAASLKSLNEHGDSHVNPGAGGLIGAPDVAARGSGVRLDTPGTRQRA